MIATRGLGYGFGALPSFGLGAGIAAAVSATGARGRRLARWVISAPSIASPVGEWIRQRDDEEILLLG
jgi:hypothetical protein